MRYISCMFRLTLKPSSGYKYIIKIQSATTEIQKYMKMYLRRHIQFVTTVWTLSNDMNNSNNFKILA
jgi:hypothetical protein